jgi:hypothetical protein
MLSDAPPEKAVGAAWKLKAPAADRVFSANQGKTPALTW